MILAPTSQSAALVFTAATVLIGIAIVLISPTWKSIQNALAGMQPAQQRAAFNGRNFEDERYKRRAWILNFLFWGCASLAVSIFFNLFALLGITATMLGLHLGPFEIENFNWGIYFIFAGGFTFILGVFYIGLVRTGEAIAFKLGKPSLLFITDGAFRRRQRRD